MIKIKSFVYFTIEITRKLEQFQISIYSVWNLRGSFLLKIFEKDSSNFNPQLKVNPQVENVRAFPALNVINSYNNTQRKD